jgi:hypothetical protein
VGHGFHAHVSRAFIGDGSHEIMLETTGGSTAIAEIGTEPATGRTDVGSIADILGSPLADGSGEEGARPHRAWLRVVVLAAVVGGLALLVVDEPLHQPAFVVVDLSHVTSDEADHRAADVDLNPWFRVPPHHPPTVRRRGATAPGCRVAARGCSAPGAGG